MSASELRQAAALIRERAEAATEGRWSAEFISGDAVPEAHIVDLWFVMGHFASGNPTGPVSTSEYEPDAAHIASWHPAVALAVADWLEEVADIRRVITGLAKHAGSNPDAGSDCFLNMESKALAVACVYLGSP